MLGKISTHADITTSTLTSTVDAETWAWNWASENIWAEEIEVHMTAREKKEARIAALIAEQSARAEAKQAQLKALKKAKKEADKATKVVLQEAVKMATETATVELSKSERAKLVSSAMMDIQIINSDDNVFLTMGPIGATISMVETFTGKTGNINRKKVELKTVTIGPLPVLACTGISARFLKSGLRSTTTEKDGLWFLEYESGSVQSELEQRNRISIVLDELIKDGCIDSPLYVKLNILADKPAKQYKAKSRNTKNDHSNMRIRF